MIIGRICIEIKSKGYHAQAQRAWIQTVCLDPFPLIIGSDTLLKPNTLLRFFSRPYIDPSVFFTDPICIILSIIQLKISQGWNYTLTSPLNKKTRLMGCKYTMNPLNSKFINSSFLTFLAYIFSKSISLKYH